MPHDKKRKMDSRYFIKFALENKITWNMLKFFMNDLTPNFVKAKEAIAILLEELHILHLKLQEKHVFDNNDQDVEYVGQSSNDISNKSGHDQATITENELSASSSQLHDNTNSGISDINVMDDEDDDVTLNAIYQDSSEGITNEMFLVDDFKEFNSDDAISDEGHDQIKNIVLNFETDENETKWVTVNNLLDDEAEDIEAQITSEVLDMSEHEVDPLIISRNSHEKKYSDEITEYPVTESQSSTDKVKYQNTEKRFKCKTCIKTYSSKGNLKMHENIHNEKHRFQCKTCSRVCYSNADLIIHERIHSGEKLFECETCKRTFSRKYQLNCHERLHTGEKPYICNVCKLDFRSSKSLKRHEIAHTGRLPFECKSCKKTFSTSSYLKSHERVHTGEKPFGCQTCTKSYSSKNNLKIHERIHSGERPYKCKTCFKNFISSTSLQKHENLHTGERPHQCQTCFKGFMEKGKLKNHMKVHSKDKKLECKLCFKRFSFSRNLKRHLKIHDKK